METFKILDKSNCRKCNEATCLAFASTVFTGTRRIEECPMLSKEIITRFGGGAGRAKSTRKAKRQLPVCSKGLVYAEMAGNQLGTFLLCQKPARPH